jgi:hypothetical protein
MRAAAKSGRFADQVSIPPSPPQSAFEPAQQHGDAHLWRVQKRDREKKAAAARASRDIPTG